MKVHQLLVVSSVITLLFALSSCQNTESIDDAHLTIMSYNIHHGRGMDDVVDIERIAKVISDEGADIVGLQEVDVGTERSGGVDIAAELSRLTGLEFYEFGKNLDHEGGDYGIAVLSRYPIREYENFQFEQLGNEQRSIQAMVINIDDFPILFMNTHLAHRREDEQERLNYMEAARDEIIPNFPSAKAVVFTGDFNDTPNSPTYNLVTEYLTDSWEIAGNDDEGLTIPPENPTRRIDYIFYNGNLEPLEVAVPFTLASDHLPVVAKFRKGIQE